MTNPRTQEADRILNLALGADYKGMSAYYAQGYQGAFTIAQAMELGGCPETDCIVDGFHSIEKEPVYWGSPEFTFTFTPDKHNAGDGACAIAIDVFEGASLGGAWDVWQPECE